LQRGDTEYDRKTCENSAAGSQPYINGITINPLEYILNDDGSEMQFESKQKAIEFLKENGFSDNAIFGLFFKDVESGEEVE